MVVDTSAIVAILFRESERSRFYDKILDNRPARISAVSYVEAGMVLAASLGSATQAALDRILDKAGIIVVEVTQAQSRLALEAFRRFGKGRHPAGLNFGDCFSYALAKESGEPLLFKGSDFSKTDIEAAI